MEIVIKSTDDQKEIIHKVRSFLLDHTTSVEIEEDSVFGILKNSPVDPMNYQEQIRNDWL